jgi:hypothetical protein
MVSSQRKASTESRMTASPLFELEAGITPCFSMRLSHAQTVNRRYAFRLLVTKGIACADPGRQSREVSSKTDSVHRLCLLLLLLLLATGALALQDLLSVLVELKLGDDDLGGSEGDGDGLAVGLLADDCIVGEYNVL